MKYSYIEIIKMKMTEMLRSHVSLPGIPFHTLI